MKPIPVVEELESEEETDCSPIPLVLSSASSGSFAGKGIATDSTSVGESVSTGGRVDVVPTPVPAEAREYDGRPPLLPQNLYTQQREDHPKPLIVNRGQSGGTAVSALTEISPEGSPLARANDDRKSLWDENAQFLDTGVRVEESPLPLWSRRESSANPQNNERLSVNDLHATSPLEAEAETSILKAIEEREENEPSTVGQCAFPCIPETVVESFQDRDKSATESHAPSQSRPGLQRAKTGITPGRRGTNLESTLLDLTAAMRDMHEQSEDVPVIPEEGERRSSLNDQSFIDNANVLFRRRTARRENGKRNLALSETQDEKDEFNYVDLELGENQRPPDETVEGPQEDDGRTQRGGRHKRFCFKSVEEDWSYFSDFLRPRRATIMLHLKTLLLAFILPATAVSLVLFYAFDNPSLNREGASISWFILFLVRHSILYTLARLTQLILIDFLALNTRWTVRTLGPFPSLCLVQSKGFPFLLSCWGLYATLTLSGSNRFAKHWMFYQDVLLMLSEENPAGTITESQMNYKVLACAIGLGIVATIKRVCLGLYFGRRIYAHFGDDVAKVVRKLLLVGEVAALAKDLELGASLEQIQMRAAVLTFNVEAIEVKNSEESEGESGNTSSVMSFSNIIDKARRDRYTGSISESQRNELMGLLESWEEPETAKKEKVDDAPISAILQFRQALVLAANDFPFSMSFGLADTREHCIESSQKVYKRLLIRQPDEGVLDFDTIALLATTDDGGIDREKMKELIRLFRPQRDGTLTMVDFVKSVDNVYKQLRLLSASVTNATQIDKAAERIFNCIFYLIVTIIIIVILGFDPMAMFLSISSIIVAFAFMISNASSRWFEGMLFVLARRPYGIGDRIHVSPVDQDSNPNGSSTWYVEHVDLFSTSIRFATTNEVATVANGSLANTRVINGARSPKMLVYVYMKFGVDVSYQKVKLFRNTMEEFVKHRPRDWLSMCGFRATRVEHQQGFIEYVMVLQHRERWQNVVAMLNAKAELSSFANEVAKKLNMAFRSPALPVDLSMGRAIMNRMKDEISAENNLRASEETRRRSDETNTSDVDMSDLAALFANKSVG